MDKKEFLKSLLECASPSGYEEKIGYLIRDYLFEGLNANSVIYNSETFYAQQGKGPKKILLSAHHDEIGFQVQYISDSGLVYLSPVGGLDFKVLPGSVVEIYSSKKSLEVVTGIIGKTPIHLDTERDKISTNIKDFSVDLGATSKEEAQNLVGIGDYGVIRSTPIINFGEHRVMGRALDDKIGVYIVTQVAKELAHWKVPEDYSLVYAYFSQEETGLRGAKQAVPYINPSISIDVDVIYSTDDERGISKEKCGEINLGKGPVINHGPDKNRGLNQDILRVAQSNAIDIQEIVTKPGGTNTDAIWVGSEDCKTTHISIPLRNMHTPVEVCDWRDIDGAIKLLVETIKELTK